MTPVQIQDSILAQVNGFGAQIAQQAGLQPGATAPVQNGEYVVTGVLDPKVRYVCTITVGDSDPNIPGT